MNRYLRRRQRRMERDSNNSRRYAPPRDYGMDYDAIEYDRRRQYNNPYMRDGSYARGYGGYAMDGRLEGESYYNPNRYYYPRQYDGHSKGGLEDEEYHRDLQEWISKMKPRDRFNMTKEQVAKQAESMGANFNDYSDEEFYAIYLAMVTDYSDITSDPSVFVRMALNFLKDNDVEMKGSDKVCAYLYSIVLGDDD